MDCDRAVGIFAVNVTKDFLNPKIRNLGVTLILSAFAVSSANGQAMPYARTFSKPKLEVEQALKDLQAYTGQKLPIVDGFVSTPQHPLDKYERAFYQFSIEVLPGVPAGTIVQVSAKITAWYADKDPAKSGYEILPSNGRLELDLLDRLDEKFGNKPAPGSVRSLATSGISAPTPKLNLGGGINMSPGGGNPIVAPEGTEELNRLRSEREAEEKRMRTLNLEMQGLEEVKKNQVHPLNLVTVKRAGTPVMARASEESRVLFKATVNDEFEFLDAEGEWVHVQISGVSRGYIRRSGLELPELIAEHLEQTAKAESAAKREAFRIEREENGVFPSGWEALKGKAVKIYTVQPVSQDPKQTDGRAKLNFAGSLMQKFVAEVTPGAPAADGVVVIFDSADGGIVGATLATIQQLATREISEEAFWKQCYLDPPEIFQSKR
jgi:hypothetical protein